MPTVGMRQFDVAKLSSLMYWHYSVRADTTIQKAKAKKLLHDLHLHAMHTDPNSAASFAVRWVHALRVKACDWGRQKASLAEECSSGN